MQIHTLVETEDRVAIVIGATEAIEPLNIYPITTGTFTWHIPLKYHYKDKIKGFTKVEQKEEFAILSDKKFQIILSKGGYKIDPPLFGDPR